MHQCLITTFKKRPFLLLRLHGAIKKKKSSHILPRRISIKRKTVELVALKSCKVDETGKVGLPLQGCLSGGFVMASHLDTHDYARVVYTLLQPTRRQENTCV